MSMPSDPVKAAQARQNYSDSAKRNPRHRSKHQRGEANTSYKGGSIDKHGYRLINIRRGKQEFEHRIVMEGVVGRPLLSHETVHHKNGQRADNRPENLELWSSRNPRGQRISDKIEFAHEILSLYAPLVSKPPVDSQFVNGLLYC